jgi:hypothetical protein
LEKIHMEMTAISFTEEEVIRLEAIKPKVRAKGSRALTSKKGTGIPR